MQVSRRPLPALLPVFCEGNVAAACSHRHAIMPECSVSCRGGAQHTTEPEMSTSNDQDVRQRRNTMPSACCYAQTLTLAAALL